MEKGTSVELIERDCPICDKVHKIEKKKRKAVATIKNEKTEYDEYYYICTNTDGDNEFVFEKLMDENLQMARDSYRIKHNLLTSNQIAQVRKKYNLTQLEFAKLLGLGDVTITRYESKQIQEQTYDSMIKLIDKDSLFALESLKRNKSRFTQVRYKEIEKCIKNNIDKDYYTKQEILSKYIQYSDKNISNGYKTLDIPKLENVIAYIAKQCKGYLYKVKLMKLLWYSDTMNYKLYGCSMTGLVYEHMPYGALPIGYNEILELPSIIVNEQIGENENIQYNIEYNNIFKIQEITPQEKEILDTIIKKFKTSKTDDIVNYMHQEKAYKQTKMGEIISYEYAKELSLSKN